MQEDVTEWESWERPREILVYSRHKNYAEELKIPQDWKFTLDCKTAGAQFQRAVPAR